jgi:WD40 repeat protein
VESGKELKRIQAHKQHAYRAAFSPDGKRIVSGGDDDAVGVWDGHSGKGLCKYPGHGADPKDAVFFPDGKRIAATNWGGTARVWRAPR